WNGAPAGVSTDIYALGVLLYHLTTGRFPFLARSVSELRDAVMAGQRVPLLDARPDLPAALAHVIDKACELDPQRRPHSAGLLSRELSEFLTTPQPAKSSRRRVLMEFTWLLLPFAGGIGVYLYLGHNRSVVPAPAPEMFLEAQKLIARYDQPGNIDRAIPLLDATVEADPNFALAFSLRAQANTIRYISGRDQKFLDLAVADANRALAINHELTPVYVTLGILHLTTGRRDVAVQDLQRALSLDPSNAHAHRVMGSLLAQQGRIDDALRSIQKAIDLDPDDWQGYQSLGNVQQRRGNNRSAIEAFTQGLRKTPDNPLMLTNLGFAQLRAEDFSGAIESLQHSVAIAPRYLSYANLCEALLLEGRFSEAAANCEKAVVIAPENYNAWGDLGSAYQWMPEGKATAEKHFRKAIELAEKERIRNPKDARVLVKLGTYLASVNDKSRAIVYVRQALALAPDDVEILFQAGEAFEAAGLRLDAVNAVNAALEHGFSPTYLDRSPQLTQLRNDPRLKRRKPITPSTH
ncbi:MAG: tetratricopeptide repeat protein, partial [Acidobacteriota bacterium]